ncbi:hypothetical protein AHFPHNDE_01150 [Pseudomonas sp. MM227]|uniref:hypothetical protein n=1 Tax=Pseudomonas sp. MM227 TaxID=3019968 RepID=UPI00221FB7D9|nr:hypothetical protein [Pseudomonas sp. MM227]CAI3787486.1 hypothetical protein AHFPHNDE_01150 [Pseudomonas sp. MM227]
MISNETREQFEVWAATKGMALHLDRGESGLYVSRVTQNYMDCWVASRAAVKLPEPCAWIGDYAACGGGKAVFDRFLMEKITDRMCEKTPVYDMAGLMTVGLMGGER